LSIGKERRIAIFTNVSVSVSVFAVLRN
jgi:hypothetical protein